jgi:glutaconate CoA-transferase subunit B
MSQQTHAPNLHYIAGGSGAVNPHLDPLVFSSCDDENLRSDAALALPDIILLEGHGKRFDVFFAGGLQIDKYGNCNLICIGDWDKPALRGPGTVGLPFLPRAGRVVIYTTSHNARTLIEKVDFNSGPGFLDGPESWESKGLPGKGPSLVVTPLCVMDFHEETRIMRLKSLHPGVTLEQVIENTGFQLVIPDILPTTQEPTETELAYIDKVDPKGIVKNLF